MHLRRACSILCVLLAGTAIALAGTPHPTARQIADTAKWFDSLDWPALHDAPYVEITFAPSSGPSEDRRREIRAFLLSEDEQTTTVFRDGTSFVRDGVSYPQAESPLEIYQLPRGEETGKFQKLQLLCRKVELADAVNAVLARQHLPRDPNNPEDSSRDQLNKARVSLFVLARCCQREGHPDLAYRLERELLRFPAEISSDSDQPIAFQKSIEETIVGRWLKEVMEQYVDPQTPRGESLAKFERIERAFPLIDTHLQVVHIVALLKTMVAEDQAHKNATRPLDSLTGPERIAEWIYRLRDQTGRQQSWLGEVDIFSPANPCHPTDPPTDTPADGLAKLGLAAVPALLDALNDERLSRVTGYEPGSRITGPIWVIGGCAERILGRIAGRHFNRTEPAPADEAAAKNDPAAPGHRAIPEWWADVQKRGEQAVLVAGVQSGGDDSADQAELLVKLDPSIAADAIDTGIRAPGASDDTRTRLMETIATMKTDRATSALHRELRDGPALHVRVAAASALLLLGDPDAVPAMIEEWNRWKPTANDFSNPNDPDPLIHFLGSCGDLSAMRALGERFADLPLATKFTLLQNVTGADAYERPVRDPDKPLPPEVSAFGEQIAVSALDDQAVFYGAGGSGEGKDGTGSYVDPRVYDMAANDLARAQPARYDFEWRKTRVERDGFIAHARNVWRVADGQAPLPLTQRPASVEAERRPNLVTSCRWLGGPPLSGFPLAEGKIVTAAALVDALIRLHRELPANSTGFGFVAERPGDFRGFAVAIEWRPGPRPKQLGNWDFNADVTKGSESIYNRNGGVDPSLVGKPANYRDARPCLDRALGSVAQESVVVHYNSRQSKD